MTKGSYGGLYDSIDCGVEGGCGVEEQKYVRGEYDCKLGVLRWDDPGRGEGDDGDELQVVRLPWLLFSRLDGGYSFVGESDGEDAYE